MPVPYQELPQVIQEAVNNPAEKAQLLTLLASCPPELTYYRGWVRVGDINVLMRLRDWRPHGAVIAPLVLCNTLIQEATEELRRYSSNRSPDPQHQ